MDKPLVIDYALNLDEQVQQALYLAGKEKPALRSAVLSPGMATALVLAVAGIWLELPLAYFAGGGLVVVSLFVPFILYNDMVARTRRHLGQPEFAATREKMTVTFSASGITLARPNQTNTDDWPNITEVVVRGSLLHLRDRFGGCLTIPRRLFTNDAWDELLAVLKAHTNPQTFRRFHGEI